MDAVLAVAGLLVAQNQGYGTTGQIVGAGIGVAASKLVKLAAGGTVAALWLKAAERAKTFEDAVR